MPNSKNLVMASKSDDDRLSDLPDEVLITILSFLKAIKVVQTCILSKRWRNIWTFVPCLDFVEDYLIHNKSYRNLVTSVLRLRDDVTDLHSLKLLYKPSSYAMSWIRDALRRNVKNLEIVLLRQIDFNLPDCLFTCESLELLSCFDIRSQGEMVVPDNVFLPKLRNVKFRGVNLNGNSIEKFISGCPALEIVRLDCCDIRKNYMSFQTVRKLEICSCDFCCGSELLDFSISAPRLEYLDFSTRRAYDIKFRDMFMVRKAKIEIHAYRQERPLSYELLSSYLSIEDLHISINMSTEVLRSELWNCPTFHNLKKFSSGICMCCDFGVFSSFLKHCPNLEHLVLCHHYDFCETWRHQVSEEMERFSCDRLRIIEVRHNGQGVQRVLLLAEYKKKTFDDVETVVLNLSETTTYILFEKIV